MTGEQLLHIRDLRKTFDAEVVPVRALRGIDLDVHQGEFVAVRGPSGCGKSTLLHLIAGLDTPDGGEIEIAGEQIVGQDSDHLAHMRRRHIGMVFQFFNLIEDLTALENVTMSALIAGTPRRSAIGRAHDLLDLLGIADKTDEYPATLSGGQKQRLAIARALANEPSLLLADEPTGALDTTGGAEIVELFRRLQANHGQTVIVVTHSGDVAAAADRILTMRDGRLAAPGESSHGPDADRTANAANRLRATPP